MFDWALETERDLGLNFWEEECPEVEGMSFAVPAAGGGEAKAVDWAARLNNPAEAVDQRVKMPRWMEEFKRKGGELVVKEAQSRGHRGICEQPRSGDRGGGEGCVGRALRAG